MLRQGLKKFRLFTLAGTTATTGVSTQFLPEFDFGSVTFRLDTDNVSGTSPALDVYLQTSPDGGATWYDSVHFAQVTAALAAGSELWATVASAEPTKYHGAAATKSIAASAVGIPLLDRQVRLAWTIAGTSPTFDIIVDAFLNNIQH